MNSTDERALVTRAQKNPAGFGELFDLYYDRIYAYAYRRVGAREHAEDVAASVFEDALRNIKRFKWNGAPVSAWLYRIAQRRVADFYRCEKPASQVTANDAVGEGPAAGFERAERGESIRRALDCLNSKDREIIKLVFFDDLETEEIAALYDCRSSNVYVRLHRALKKLERILDDKM